jgi:hypothetical protein
LATIVPGAAKLIQPPMNADKANASQAQHDALDLQARAAEVAQQADTFSRNTAPRALQTVMAPR